MFPLWKWSTALVAVALLGVLSVMLSACGQNLTTPTPLVDTGPNAQVSNEELYAKALANMKTLTSHHFEFTERPQNPAPGVRLCLTITGDIQLASKGSRLKIQLESNNPQAAQDSEASAMLLGMSNGDVSVVGNTIYKSDDGGKTWARVSPQALDPAMFIVLLYGSMWQMPMVDTIGQPATVEGLVKGATWREGSPRLGVIDDVLTRHIVTDVASSVPPEYQNPFQPWSERALTIHLWVSTDDHPMVRQMQTQVFGSNQPLSIGTQEAQPADVPYTLTWKWSRFNEDFGPIEAPLVD